MNRWRGKWLFNDEIVGTFEDIEQAARKVGLFNTPGWEITLTHDGRVIEAIAKRTTSEEPQPSAYLPWTYVVRWGVVDVWRLIIAQRVQETRDE